ncbi:MAG: hypothetical protein OSJ71_06575 [Acetatifactor sp.]|jgi:hypothetical protein|nr:hypothetical protein [Acetatifactor sp.]
MAAIKDAKTIAEYAIKKWLIKEGIALKYIPESKSVIVKEEQET